MGQIQVVYRASNTFTVPAGVTSVVFEAEGAGGTGGGGGLLAAGGGGGGGAYALKTQTTTPGQTYTITVAPRANAGASNAAGPAGTFSQVTLSSTVICRGAGGNGGGAPSGLGGLTAGAGGAGGTVANSTGDTRNAGVNGVNGGAGGRGGLPLGDTVANGGYEDQPGSGRSTGGGGAGGAAVTSSAGTVGAQGIVRVTFDYTDETVSATDTFLRVVDWNRTNNETVASADAIAKLFLRPFSDSVTATDTQMKLYVKKAPDEVVTATDAFRIAYNILRSETVLTQDVINKLISMPEVESVLTSDTFVKLIRKNQNETVTAADTIAQYLRKPVAGSVTVTDAILVVLVFLRYVNDTATAVDLISKAARLGKADAATAVDTQFKLFIKKAPDEEVFTDDAFSKVSMFNRLPADTATAADLLAKVLRIRFDDSISGNSTPVPTGRRKIYVLGD